MGRYSSVGEMVNALSGESLAEEFVEFDKKTWLSQHLSALRVSSGMTEKEVAEKLGRKEKSVIDFEYEEMGKISVKDMALYLDAIGFNANFVFTNKKATHIDKIKCLVLETAGLLSEIVEISEPGEDEKITEEVSNFLIEYFVNVSKLFLDVVSSQFTERDADVILAKLEEFQNIVPDQPEEKIQFLPPIDVSSIQKEERNNLLQAV